MGTDPQRYLAHLQLRCQHTAVEQLEQLFFVPVAELFSHHFGLPLAPLTSRDGSPLPGWALREMASGGGIPEHCEQDWNPLNLIENGTLCDAALEPAFQLSFLYGVTSATQGGELQISAPETCVPLPPGELLLFNAGCHRHQVLPTSGPELRVVLGGFLRLNRSHTRLHCYV
ncbi:2OG-Fe(II) oxygenase [Synechococcus sp. BS56D]|uniref:2OG-Fe(II) oxygenase n=1 Tax=Synechococcus sp. BS56D TaxID=2055944 RepID=UPI001F10612B|nr:2OG-Fe(II) oxygenase [Synechococcus sp. BS56D]